MSLADGQQPLGGAVKEILTFRRRSWLCYVTLVTGLQGCSSEVVGNDVGVPYSAQATYALANFEISPTGPVIIGMNVDGRFSDSNDALGCLHGDRMSFIDNDQQCRGGTADSCATGAACISGTPGCVGGVDNQLPVLADLLMNAHIDVRTNTLLAANGGRVTLLIQVTGIDNFAEDSEVHGSIALGRSVDGCDSGDSRCGEYSILRESLAPGSRSLSGALVNLSGRIAGGRMILHCDDADMPLPIGFGPRDVQWVETRGCELRANISAVALSDGVVSGSWSADDIRQVLLQRGRFSSWGIESLVGEFVDLYDTGICSDFTSNPPRFGRTSVGFGFDGVTTRISQSQPVTDSAVTDGGR